MGVIHVLETQLANQIAAGEVVERPASIVKELCENAIDAGANRIVVKISDGGMSSVNVIDNGCGMSREDMEIAFLRHATSKIASAADLDKIATLGFRGEALPSIAAVARVTVKSREAGNIGGYQIKLDEQGLHRLGEVGMPEGTNICVEELFYNTPARKKFLKSASAEANQITALVSRLVLSRPDITFVLERDGRVIINSAGANLLAASAYNILGADVVNMLAEVSQHNQIDDEPITIEGLISKPPFSRSNRKYYYFFINGRAIVSRELARIVDDFYANYLPQGKYPVVLLHLTLPPHAVDVNVHPNKIEVRFRDIAFVESMVRQALSSVVCSSADFVPDLRESTAADRAVVDDLFGEGSGVIRAEEVARPLSDQLDFSRATLWQSQEQQVQAATLEAVRAGVEDALARNSTQDSWLTKTAEAVNAGGNIYEKLQVIGQLAGSFILASFDGDLYIIDQHAAHERIRYEKFAAKFAEVGSSSALLALPLRLELSPLQTETLIDCINDFNDLGFIVEFFGDNTFLLRGIPAWYEGNERPEDLFCALLDKIIEEGAKLAKYEQETLFTMACHSSVRANRYLNQGDMSFLISELAKLGDALSCPHGRPISVKITQRELRHRFLR